MGGVAVRSVCSQPVHRALLYLVCSCFGSWYNGIRPCSSCNIWDGACLESGLGLFLFCDDTLLCAVELRHAPCCALSTVGLAGEVACIGRGCQASGVVEVLCSYTWLWAPGMLSSLVLTALCIQHTGIPCALPCSSHILWCEQVCSESTGQGTEHQCLAMGSVGDHACMPIAVAAPFKFCGRQGWGAASTTDPVIRQSSVHGGQVWMQAGLDSL